MSESEPIIIQATPACRIEYEKEPFHVSITRDENQVYESGEIHSRDQLENVIQALVRIYSGEI